ncbi:MAG TPA: carbohydrate porin [Kofleriaceae bacterium]|nr:carbohydrate porin [Kofleriaceae bacterium]
MVVLAASAPVRADDGVVAPPWWISGELDAFVIGQSGFHSRSSGAHSLSSSGQLDGTVLATVTAGYTPTSITALVVSGQSIAGDAPSDGHGLGAPLEDDYVRSPGAGAVPFLGSAFVDQVIPLSSERESRARDPLHLLSSLPRRRLELRAGQLWAPDWFDGEPLGFRNAAIRHDGAWDYPANDRGYTVGVVAEYASALWRVRFAELTMPKVPRGGDYDLDLANARSEIAEVQAHTCILGHPGFARVGGYIDHANMGNYAIAIGVFETGETDTPDVTMFRTVGNTRRGWFAGYDQDLGHGLRAFVGASASDGGVETFGTNEIDDSFRIGATARGTSWTRPLDEAGLGFASNGLSSIHQSYLALGGLGPILGDGSLHYSRENVGEAYYDARVIRGVRASAHFELIVNPGFYANRGPVEVGELRVVAVF